MDTTGLDGGNRTKSASAIASRTPGAGAAPSAPTGVIASAGTAACSRTHHSWKWISSPAHLHARLDPVVGHRQQPDARLPALAQHPGDLGQRLTRREQLAAEDVRGEVEVAEREPGRPRAVGGELVADAMRLVRAPPALFLVAAAAERVHHRVQVWADPQAEQGDVVGGVADDGDRRVGGRREQAAQEARGADAAGKHGNPHGLIIPRGDDPPYPRPSGRAGLIAKTAIVSGPHAPTEGCVVTPTPCRT